MADDDEVARQMAEKLGALSPEDRKRMNQAQLEESTEQHTRFQTAFREGHCYICDDTLESFDEKRPCLHWLLRPDGFSKRHLPALAKVYGLMRTQSWLRWVASEGAFARNITDTAVENGEIVQSTMKYGRYQWSLSCSKSDFVGHGNQRYPHYHLQMWIEGKPFINYSQFRLPLLPDEITDLRGIQASGGAIKVKFPHGESFEDLMAATSAEEIVGLPLGDGDPAEAPWNIGTMMIADEGTYISGEAIHDMFTKAREQRVTFASLAPTMPNVSTQILIEPGPGVVEPALRTPVRSGRKNQEG